MARIYTRAGDGGETSLLSGARVSKADVRVDLYGTVDELNSWLGICAVMAQEAVAGAVAAGRHNAAALSQLAAGLATIQGDLLEMGSVLADPEASARLAATGPEALAFSALPLERQIDRMSAQLPPLKRFVLPGGHPVAAALHVARSVCRRTERLAVAARARETLPGGVIVYLNRLGDLLFVAARWANQLLGLPDVVWQAKPDRPVPRDPEEGSCRPAEP
jgi:cob(I)alamin adenosyltransferase